MNLGVSCGVEIIKISRVSPRTHLLTYINKDRGANAPTFESLKELITIPIVYVAEKDAEEYVKDILKWKMLYNYIKENNLEDKIEDKQMDTMFRKHSNSNM